MAKFNTLHSFCFGIALTVVPCTQANTDEIDHQANSVGVAKRPNIVIIVADDLGYADPSFRGSQIDTPVIDSLAHDGMVMERFYTAPICSPTRAALMTGRDPMSLGIAYSVVLPWDVGGIHPRERLMPETLRAAGYQTAVVGKWHLGHSQEQFTPLGRGFNEFFGHLHTDVGYYPPFAVAGGKDFQLNGRSIEHEGYGSYMLADHASEWINSRDKEKPFFLYLPFLAPHEPLAAPQELLDKYADLEDRRAPARSPSDDGGVLSKMANAVAPNRRGLYAAVVEAMDTAIGTVMTTLEKESIAENTIVLFFSDNGATRVPSRGGGDNAPLRGGKAETYEGGIRVVSIVRWPDQIPAGTTNQNIMTVMDVLPTLAAAVNVELDGELEVDGKNMLASLTEQKTVARDDTLFFASEIPTYGSFNFAALHDDWKLVQWVEQNPTSTTLKHELYNLKEDPSEYNNLANKYPELVQELAKEILNWRASHPINGTRARLAPPPGWRAPLDWADYARHGSELQIKPRSSVAPSATVEHVLDQRLGKRGRIIYNCKPSKYLGGICANELNNEQFTPQTVTPERNAN